MVSFCKTKLQELNILKENINDGKAKDQLSENKTDIEDRKKSKLIHDETVKTRVKTINDSVLNRVSKYEERANIQKFLIFLYTQQLPLDLFLKQKM